MDLIMKLSVICPGCRASRPGERAEVGDHIVTLCYCNSCGVTWTRERDFADEPEPKRPARSRRTIPRRNQLPAATDLLLRGSFADGYELVEVASGRRIAAGLNSLDEVRSVARRHGGHIWQQQADRFGRPMGKPIRLILQTQ